MGEITPIMLFEAMVLIKDRQSAQTRFAQLSPKLQADYIERAEYLNALRTEHLYSVALCRELDGVTIVVDVVEAHSREEAIQMACEDFGMEQDTYTHVQTFKAGDIQGPIHTLFSFSQ